MAAAVEANWQGPLHGLVVTRYGHGAACRHIDVVEAAAHPVPDKAGEAATRRILDMVTGLGPDDLVLCLISGGGSSLLSLPEAGLALADKRWISSRSLRNGANISEMNCMREHLSAINGGWLAIAAALATVIDLIISILRSELGSIPIEPVEPPQHHLTRFRAKALLGRRPQPAAPLSHRHPRNLHPKRSPMIKRPVGVLPNGNCTKVHWL